jgi:hypothetical protein
MTLTAEPDLALVTHTYTGFLFWFRRWAGLAGFNMCHRCVLYCFDRLTFHIAKSTTAKCFSKANILAIWPSARNADPIK